MVFSNLAPSEKDAFFSLLDEYFASRPDVFGNAASGAPASSTQPARSVPSIPVNTASLKSAASTIHNAFSAHTNQPNETSSSEPAWKRIGRNPSPQPSGADASQAMGRVAAAAAMFKSSPVAAMGAPPPRPPARRPSSTASPPQEDDEPAPSPPLPSRTLSSASKLVTQKKFGDVDVTSGKNMYMSIRHGTANKHATPPSVAPPVPSALPHVKASNYGPPPVRRVSSTASSTPSETARSVPPPPPPPPRPTQEEPEPEGEWAEAVYEYTSDDPGDLQLQEGQRVLIVERTSDDWWTGEFQGKRGLVPASYMKML